MKHLLIFFLVLGTINYVFSQDASLIYKNTVNSTVTIETDNGLGSGFFVAPNIVATNYHVMEGAKSANCYMNNSNIKYKVDGYLGADKSVDLILLKVSTLDKPAIKFASTNISIGQSVYVIGSPKGFPATISDGIISGMRDFEGYKLIQMTAPISPGSSGGPVLNANGELIGISVSQLKDGQNINFAIPKSYLEILLNFKKDTPMPLSTLYNSNEIKQNNDESNFYEKDKTYEFGVFKKGTPELSLDYMANFGKNTCFYFTYDMANSALKSQTIYMEDYRIIDLETGEIYYAKVTDLSSRENSRIIYKGTKTRFLVCFDRLPTNVRRFSLMEGECSASSFCFLNINLNNYPITTDVDWNLYKGNKNEGTISFYVNQPIGDIDIYVENYFVGTLTKYFTNQSLIPSCGETGGAIVTVRLPVGTYNYSATSKDLIWKGKFTITREGCVPFRLRK